MTGKASKLHGPLLEILLADFLQYRLYPQYETHNGATEIWS